MKHGKERVRKLILSLTQIHNLQMVPTYFILNLGNFFISVCALLSPDRQCASGLLRKFRGVDKHQFEQELQVANLASQTGADDPSPVPALSFTPASKVHQHWRKQRRWSTAYKAK